MALLYDTESYAVLGACFEVYKEMGCGFVEPVYQECLAFEFGLQNLPFIPQSQLKIFYKGHLLEQKYRPDFLCFELILLELKAVSGLNDAHRAQLHNYLKVTNLRVGYLINFGHHPKV